MEKNTSETHSSNNEAAVNANGIDKDTASHETDAEKNTAPIDQDDQQQNAQDTPEQEDWYDKFVRLTADFDNFRKRSQKEKFDLLKYGHESLMADILPVLDNFERAAAHAKEAKDIKAVQDGVSMILQQFKSELEKHGLKIQDNKGKEFDPILHEAVSHVESKDIAENHIIEEHQKGYHLHDKLLRPALVSVSKG